MKSEPVKWKELHAVEDEGGVESCVDIHTKHKEHMHTDTKFKIDGPSPSCTNEMEYK